MIAKPNTAPDHINRAKVTLQDLLEMGESFQCAKRNFNFFEMSGQKIFRKKSEAN
jgi:hypothetical protein